MKPAPPETRLDNIKRCLQERPEMQEVARLMGVPEERIRDYSAGAYRPPKVLADRS
jgi:hypothetical protein